MTTTSLRAIASALLIACCCWSAPLAAADKGGQLQVPEIPPASPNKGKIGTYHCTTKHPGYDYWVCVPPKYSDAAPAGLHVFFHGQNCQNTAPNFGLWDHTFLVPYNLIGINMQYLDGDNDKDTIGKVAAAQEAIAQTMADYRIIAGRGVVACFSGGGATHGLYAERMAKVRGLGWPYCHSASYSANYDRSAVTPVPMTWYIGVGTAEWDMFNLGVTAVRRADELFKAQAAGGCPDVFFQVIKGKGHTIVEQDVEVSASLFPRSDLAFAPFVYAPDFPEPELQGIVERLNRLELQGGLAALDRLVKSAGTPAKVKSKASTLRQMAEARIDQAVAMAKTLAVSEPVLCNWYGPLILEQIKGHAKEKELRAALAAAAKGKTYQACVLADQEFTKLFPKVFGPIASPKPDLAPDIVAALTALIPQLNPLTQVGRMTTGWLPAAGKK